MLVVPALVHASETSIAFRYERSFKENKYYQPEMELAHKFDNGLAVNALQKRRETESTKDRGYRIQETTVGVAYGFPLGGNKNLTLTPKLEYQWKSHKEIVRPSLKLYYKIDSTWGVGARYRYEYQSYNGSGENKSRVSRYDLYVDYNVTDKLKLSYDPSYHNVSGTTGGTFHTDEYYKFEHWLGASYKVNAGNTVGIIYKWKEKNSETSKWNPDDHDTLVQVSYVHRF
nr:oligogalacturonate-specific porin KdgM family protein [Pseudomonas karstica]